MTCARHKNSSLVFSVNRNFVYESCMKRTTYIIFFFDVMSKYNDGIWFFLKYTHSYWWSPFPDVENFLNNGTWCCLLVIVAVLNFFLLTLIWKAFKKRILEILWKWLAVSCPEFQKFKHLRLFQPIFTFLNLSAGFFSTV